MTDDSEKIRIMLIDDQKTMRKIIRTLLSQIGSFDIDEAENGRIALDHINRPTAKHPDVIICDLHMDKMDGMEFCNKLRLSKNEDIRLIPILMLTGETDEMLLTVTAQVGALKVLQKPVSAPELKGHISDALGFSI